MTAIEQLDKQIESLTRRADRMDGIVTAPLGHEPYFHLGMVGGSGKPVRALDRRRERSIDRVIDAAKESIKLRQQIAGLKYQRHKLTPEGQAETAEAERKRQAEQVARDQFNAARAEALRGYRPGETVEHLIFGKVEVVRVNRVSLTIRSRIGTMEHTETAKFSDLLPNKNRLAAAYLSQVERVNPETKAQTDSD